MFARSAIKHLFEDANLYPAYIIPCSFLSLHSPHLGSRRPSQNETLLKNVMAKTIDFYLDKMIGLSGAELAIRDHVLLSGNQNESSSKQLPLLLRMSMQDSDFINALNQFKFKTLVSATHFDLIVPFCSSAIVHYNPYAPPEFNKPSARVMSHEGFDNSVQSILFGQVKNESMLRLYQSQQPLPEFDKDKDETVEFMTNIIIELQKIKWRRVNLEYTVSMQTQVINGTVHGMPINKVSPISILVSKDNEGAKNSVATTSKIIVMDHISLLAELQGVALDSLEQNC